MATANKLERRPSVKWLFSQLDKSKSGKLTKKDLEEFLGDEKQANDAFLVLDRDGDGVINSTDFEEGFVEYLQSRKSESEHDDRENSANASENEVLLKEELFEYDPDLENSLSKEFSCSLDHFEDGKLKLLNIWKRLGETRPELKSDFERLVCDIGNQLHGVKTTAKKHQEETEKQVLQLDRELEEAIEETEIRVRTKSFHALKAKEEQYNKHLKQQSKEMETLQAKMAELELEVNSGVSLKQKVSELQKDNTELEDIMRGRLTAETKSESTLGTSNGNQRRKDSVPFAELPPGVVAAARPEVERFQQDFKFSRSGWTRTNVSSPSRRACYKSNSNSFHSSEEDGSETHSSSRETTPLQVHQERGGERRRSCSPILGDDIVKFSDIRRRKSSPEALEISKLLQKLSNSNSSSRGNSREKTDDDLSISRESVSADQSDVNSVGQTESRRLSKPSKACSAPSRYSGQQEYPIITVDGELVSESLSTRSIKRMNNVTSSEVPFEHSGMNSQGFSPAKHSHQTNESKSDGSSKRAQRRQGHHQLPSNFRRIPPMDGASPNYAHSVYSGQMTELYPKVNLIEQLTETPDYAFKLLIIGNSGVGKTSFLIRLTENTFSLNYAFTVGVDFKNIHARIDQKVLALKVWDTAGQERFKAVTQSYYNGADGVILMYDVTQELSFLSIREWIDCIKETTGSVPPSLLLLGNKLDKVKMSSSRGVSFESGETMAKIFGAQFLEVSACTGQNIAEAFFTIARLLVKNKTTSSLTRSDHKVDVVTLSPSPQSQSKCCLRN